MRVVQCGISCLLATLLTSNGLPIQGQQKAKTLMRAEDKQVEEVNAAGLAQQREVEVSAHGQAVASDQEEEDHQRWRLVDQKKAPGNFFFKVHKIEEKPANVSMLEHVSDEAVDAEISDMLESTEGSSVGWEESLTAVCDEKETAMHARDGTLGRGSVSNLMFHDVKCDGPKLMSQFRVTSGGSATQMKVKYKCCKHADSLGTCRTLTAPAAPVTSDGSLMKLAQGGLEVACPFAPATGLQSWKVRNNRADGTQAGTHLAIDYSCCEVAGATKFGDGCEDDRDTASQPEDDNIQALFKHDIECSYGFVMRKWKMVHAHSKFHLQYSCCPIGKTVKMGAAGSCSWVGDPHFTTFDKTRHDPMRQDGGFYWIVKSDYIQIQSYYEGSHRLPVMRTRGIAIGGKFMLGNKLILKYDMSRLRGGGQAKESGHLPTHVCWNGACDKRKSMNVNYMDGQVAVSKNYPRVTATFPLGVKLTIYYHSWWSDQTLTLNKPLTGSFNGQCGNFNNQRADDKHLGGGDKFYISNNAQNMFLTSFTGANAGGASITLATCKANIRTLATKICSAKFAGTDSVTLSFKKMCVLDLCNTPDKVQAMEMVGGDAQAASDAEMDVDFALPRQYKVKARAGQEKIGAACAALNMKIAKPRSRGELRAILESVSQFGGAAKDFVYVGIFKQGDVWHWMKDEDTDKAEPVCPEVAKTMLAKGEEQTTKTNMCVKVSDGQWYGCHANEHHNIACEEDKKYGSLAQAGPITARSACGEGKQLAMPKNERERKRMHETIKDNKDLMFLGASHLGDDKWQWDDGSPVCGTVNWAKGQPAYPQKEAQYFLCISPVTGQWVACSGFGKRGIVCETKQPEKTCPLSKQDLSLLAMETSPGKRSRYQDRCYYMSPEKVSCTEFCLSVNPGYACDQDGLKAVAESQVACKMVIAGFGLHIKDDARSESSEPLGCTYLERKNAQSGKTKKQADLTGPKIMPSVVPPTCEAMGGPSQHRPCACKSLDEMSYPDGRMLTPGDTVNLVGEMSDAAFSETILSTGGKGGSLLSTDTKNIALKFEADPKAQTIKRSYNLKGKWHADTSNTWPFAKVKKGGYYAIDLLATTKAWEVTVMGQRLPGLDFPMDKSVIHPDGVQLQGVSNGHLSLVTQPSISANIPVSMNSANDCLEHPFTFKGPVLTWYFQLHMSTTDGLQCIRCEKANFIHGTHVYMQDGKLVLAVEGCAPRAQPFDYAFHKNTNYEIALHYHKKEKVVELYVSQERVEFLHYKRTVDVNSGPGDLGCFNEDEKLLSGSIHDFHIETKTPTFRPKAERCTSVSCAAPAFKLKVDAFDLWCAGSVCYDTVDKGKCCDTIPKCNAGFTCPQGSMLKANAKDTYCDDADCSATPISTCCEQLDLCTSYKCPAGKLHRLDVKTILCKSSGCAKVDEDKCCEPVAKCGSYSCPSGYTYKAGAVSTQCAGRHCGAKDKDTCCAQVGKCSSFNCPELMLLKPNAASIECHDATCKETHYSTCCVIQGRCDSHTCPADKVLKMDSTQVFCEKTSCGEKDHKTCCEPRDVCSSLKCQAGYTLASNASGILCESRTCVEADHSKCCVALGTCSSYECPPSYRLKPTASSILCDDEHCQTTDYHKCCGLDGYCTTYKCPPTYVHKPTAAKLHCDGFSCTNADLPMCCDRAAKCTTHRCPPQKKLNVNANELFCQDGNCTAADDGYCCVDKGLCTTVACPANFLHKHNADVLRCSDELCTNTDFNNCCAEKNGCMSLKCPAKYLHKDDAPNLHCKGMSCAEGDRDHCCREASDCSSYSCPRRYFPNQNLTNLFCEGAICTHADLNVCCQKEGFCLNMTCPLGWLHKPAAHDIACDDKSCKDTPTEKCCAPAGRCNSYKCPDRYVVKFNSSDLDCVGWLCNIKDRDMCCDAAMSCSEHTCAKGSTLRLNHADLVCHDRYCTGKDHEMCCVAQGHCHSYKCPQGYLHRQDENLLCSDKDCSDTEFSVCCAPESKCNTYSCPKGFLHKDGAEKLDCQETTGCTHIDRDTCCDTDATCSGYGCPAGLVIKTLAPTLTCEGAACVTDERLTCCTSEGKCDAYTCPPGFQHRHNANSLFCEDASCKETDFHVCCVEEGHCHSHTCPTEYVHKINATKLFCEDWICRERDTSKCCDLRAKCNEETCPTPTVQRYDAIDHLCVNRTCLAQDYGTCCTQEGKCSSLTCPPGYKHRTNANDIFCDDQNCTATSFHKCCGEEDKCHTYSCPQEFVHKHGADKLECQGFVCDLTDRDTCCSHQAWCNTYVADASYVLKADAAGILCVNETCTKQDRDTCCDTEGTCLLKDCPATHLHRPNAKDILCKDKRCLETDVATCCKSKATCSSGFTCPKLYVQKVSTDPLHCAGFECKDSDRDLCCDKDAKCNEYNPPNGYFLKHNAVNLSCDVAKCSDDDLHTCTGEAGKCSSFKCPTTFIQKHDSRHIDCEDLDCEATEYKVCCAKEGFCNTWQCPKNHVHRAGAANISCSNTTCSAADDKTCCQVAAPCNSYTCQGATQHRLKPETFYCAQKGKETLSCTKADQDTCCIKDGQCSTYPCPTGFLHRHNAHDIPCDDANCTSTDYNKCCSEEGTCPTYTCPALFAHKNQTKDVHCRDTTCTDADKYGCCDETASCQFFSCPEGKVWKDKVETLRCQGRACDREVDTDTCCEVEGAETTTTIAPETTTTVANAGDQGTEEESVQAGAWRRVELFVLLAGGFFGLMPTTLCGLRE